MKQLYEAVACREFGRSLTDPNERKIWQNAENLETQRAKRYWRNFDKSGAQIGDTSGVEPVGFYRMQARLQIEAMRNV